MAPNSQLFAKLVGNAFAIAVVGFAIAISLGKIFALRHGYRVDSNQVWRTGCGTVSRQWRRSEGDGVSGGTQGSSKQMWWAMWGTEDGGAGHRTTAKSLRAMQWG